VACRVHRRLRRCTPPYLFSTVGAWTRRALKPIPHLGDGRDPIRVRLQRRDLSLANTDTWVDAWYQPRDSRKGIHYALSYRFFLWGPWVIPRFPQTFAFGFSSSEVWLRVVRVCLAPAQVPVGPSCLWAFPRLGYTSRSGEMPELDPLPGRT